MDLSACSLLSTARLLCFLDGARPEHDARLQDAHMIMLFGGQSQKILLKYFRKRPNITNIPKIKTCEI